MLLPHISAVLPPLLDDMFFIFQRVLCWRQKISLPPSISKNIPVIHPPVKKSSVDMIVPISTSPPKQLIQPNIQFSKMDPKTLTSYLHELRKAQFYIHSMKKMENALHQLQCQKEWISKEEKSFAETYDAILMDELHSAIQSLKKFISNAKEAPLKLCPPRLLRRVVILFYQHLYGMFPYMFFQYLNTECQSNKYFKDLVTVI